MYGFANAFARTGDVRFLHTAQQLAETYLSRTPDLVPPNDWDEPSPVLAVEASAASIAAAALGYLGGLCGPEGTRFIQHGRMIVERLSQPDFLSFEDDSWEGIIKHATYHRGNGLGVDESVMWGDYYYLEAVARLYGPETPVSPEVRPR
jgi:unsaturated chondroitin disaccharide hydrolase